MIPNFSYIFKEIFAEKTRFFLTVFAIGWGTFSIASMLAVGEGLRGTFGQAMEGSGKSVLYVAGGQVTTAYQGQAMNKQVFLTEQDLKTLEKNLPLANITPEYSFSSKLRYQDNTFSFSISAVNPLFGDFRNIKVAAGGRFINPVDIKERRQVVVLGDKLAGMLLPFPINPIGLWINIGDQPFQVIGVMHQKLQLWGYGILDNYSAWIPASTYLELAGTKNITNFIVVPNDPAQMNEIKDRISRLIAMNHNLDINDKNILIFKDSHIVQEKTQQVLQGMQLFLGGVGFLTLMVAGVGVANVMFISVRKNTREIGIRMAVGARPHQILAHYIAESLFTTAIGGALGLLIAQGLISLVTVIPMDHKFMETLGVAAPKPILSWPLVCIVILVLGLVGLLAGLFPAREAMKIHPAEALRYE